MLIINGKIFTMTGKPVDCGYIRTEGKVITEVGTMSSLDKRQKGEEVLDVDGCLLYTSTEKDKQAMIDNKAVDGTFMANVTLD